VSCDINSSSDTSVPTESFLVPGDFGTNDPDFGFGVAEFGGAEVDGLPEFAPEDFGGGGGTIGDEGFGGGGGGDGDGGGGGGSDGGDATPLGPMTTEPVPGGEAGVPPDGGCEGGVLVRAMGKIGEEQNAIIEKGVDWTIPLTPPEELGLDSWIDGGFISFYVECPDGTEQYVDPIINPVTPPILTDGDYSPTGATTFTVSGVWKGVDNLGNLIQSDIIAGTTTIIGFISIEFETGFTGGIIFNPAGGRFFFVSGGTGGPPGEWQSFEGSISASTLESDAVPFTQNLINY
jgi:hypothetical protein